MKIALSLFLVGTLGFASPLVVDKEKREFRAALPCQTYLYGEKYYTGTVCRWQDEVMVGFDAIAGAIICARLRVRCDRSVVESLEETN